MRREPRRWPDEFLFLSTSSLEEKYGRAGGEKQKHHCCTSKIRRTGTMLPTSLQCLSRESGTSTGCGREILFRSARHFHSTTRAAACSCRSAQAWRSFCAHHFHLRRKNVPLDLSHYFSLPSFIVLNHVRPLPLFFFAFFRCRSQSLSFCLSL